MQYQPSLPLKSYVKGYWVFTSEQDMTNQTFFPSGYIDFAVNISGGTASTIINGRPIDMPNVEVLGQLTVPTRLTVTRGMMVLIARIFPYANALFFPNPISAFTNDSVDLEGLLGKVSAEFYDRLMQAPTIEQKVKELDQFLVQRLLGSKKRSNKVTMLERICSHISAEGELFNIKLLAHKYGFSERYIQQLFLDNVGLTPRVFFHIQRFNKSLELIHAGEQSLTSIAYDCGYFDQAHFIREFKKFTGVTPSEIRAGQMVSGV
ncbi:MAG: helix-turn-helix transcriptional regulator [Chitinophaga sp.]|uniref:helix-turn-helix domain-containing protein n=1 Tax=Chitinophaga sp. TaxID=1869181 RepID=UPI001B0D521B|nr:AraC family transcriptional regulator [Chitinophaga sp.]MBO9729407.1 helix-turn-helix transcriptional regulator [Chitinophaga sp.]